MNLKLTPKLAEACGIHAGDGYLRNDGRRRELDISGNIEEKEYYNNHIIPLFEKLFNIKIIPKFFPSRNTYGFVIRDLQIIEFFHSLGFPYGKKSTIVQIPSFILQNENKLFHTKFIRGLFDTDGCLYFSRRKKGKYKAFKKTYNYYPVISFSSVSKNLIKETIQLLELLHFQKINYCTYNSKNPNENISNKIYIYGENKLNRFIKIIGIKNVVKLSRYQIWKKFGFCPPNITLKQRKNILNGKIDPYIINKGPIV